ncbi:hypothetical protein [Proteus vulgaris]|uniref:hypothetical protein n=1 Tax=Proteus vulgaris TaxID=585 RepID=UPI0034D3BD3D
MILIIYFIAIFFIGVWIWNRKKKFALNEKSLHKQWLFWLFILFPLFSSLYFMLTLGFGYPPNMNIDGFNNFLNMHKFSLGILTLSPILGAFVVSAHRSIQTEKQIKETVRKNNVDIYFANKKFIYEQLSYVKTIDGEVISKPTSLYLNAYEINGEHSDIKKKDIYNLINSELNNKNFGNDILGKIIDTDAHDIVKKDSNSIILNSDIERYVVSINNFISRIKEIIYLEGDNEKSIIDIYIKFQEEIADADKYMRLHPDDSDEYIITHHDIYIIFKSFTKELVDKIYSILEVLYEVVVILNPLDDINNLLPSLKEHRNSIQRIRNNVNFIEAC